ncbi:hypothetical protein CCAX7_52750 [Capsulimonas corticalis]|uniref:Uncharacterized protein n=1 Tax=Capsulimonas corticalis TaxID=2219043 RepID=A0A402CP42_9BACT|nr:HD domain-containing phosphohydrolase [Capsulimonas corticalis]BDI33224.1 hypothetical protein CCAX7_52750 [Capsulimonas corticalis]
MIHSQQKTASPRSRALKIGLIAAACAATYETVENLLLLGPSHWRTDVISIVLVGAIAGGVASYLSAFSERMRRRMQQEEEARKWAEEALRRSCECLEGIVEERTQDLAAATEAMRREVEERRESENHLQESQRRMHAILTSAPLVLFAVDAKGVITLSEGQALNSLGLTPGEVVGRSVFELYRDDPQIIDVMHRALSGKRIRETTHVGDIYFDSQFSPEFDEEGRVIGAICVCTDITESVKVEVRYRSIIENAVEGIYQTTMGGRILSANPSMAAILGYDSPDELMESVDHVGRDIYHNPTRRGEFLALIESWGSVSQFDSQVRRKDGEPLWISENARCVRDSEGRVLFYEGTIQDITERRAVEVERERMLAEALAKQDLDPLTGLLNHRAFQKRFDDEATRALEDNYSLAVVVIDLDNFRFFNEVYGYQVGDELLLRVADALRAATRYYDCMARFGGDEFVVLMPGACAEDVASLRARLTQRLEEISYEPPGSESAVPLSVSAGVALFPDEAATRVLTLEMATERLHRAKTGGRDNGVDLLRASLAESVSGFSMLYGLVSAVDNKDRYTRHHSEDVMLYCLEIAEQLGWSSEEKHVLRVAALLHDVGKIGVPDSILRKPGKLTEEEITIIQEHPTLGAIIVGAIPALHPTLDAVRHHHECWNGSGYPAALAGLNIPPMARVMAVADAYSAMTTDRPYRKGMDPMHALEILRSGAGEQWDPECVAAFLSVRLAGEDLAQAA